MLIAGIIRDAVLSAPCRTASYFHLAHPLSGHPTVTHFRRLAARARHWSSPSPSTSAPVMALFNSVGGDRCGRQGGRPLPQESYPASAGIRGKVLLLAGRHRLQARNNGVRQAGYRHLLGSVVSRSRASAGRCRVRSSSCTRPRSARNRTTRASIPWSTGGSSCAGTPAPTWCRWSPPIASALETTDDVAMTFYGSSFIADHLGALCGRGGSRVRAGTGP